MIQNLSVFYIYRRLAPEYRTCKVAWAAGGHNVDVQKIKERYFRSLKLFSSAAMLAETAFLINNSKNFELMAQLSFGKAEFIFENYPEWLKEYYEPK